MRGWSFFGSPRINSNATSRCKKTECALSPSPESPFLRRSSNELRASSVHACGLWSPSHMPFARRAPRRLVVPHPGGTAPEGTRPQSHAQRGWRALREQTHGARRGAVPRTRRHDEAADPAVRRPGRREAGEVMRGKNAIVCVCLWGATLSKSSELVCSSYFVLACLLPCILSTIV